MSESLDRRDFFVESTVRAAKLEGREVDAEQVGREAARDLALLDKAVASGEINLNPDKPKKPDPVPKSDAAAKAARERGQSFIARPEGADDRRLPAISGVEALKLLAMDRRLRILCKPVPGYRFKCDKDGLLDEPIGNGCEYPLFANLVFMHTAGFSRGLMSYKGLNYEDRKRKYNRAIEDICDRSDAAVGYAWWVK